MSRVDITLPGSSRPDLPLRACQGKKCAGAERIPEGGVDLSPTKWVCGACWNVVARRLPR